MANIKVQQILNNNAGQNAPSQNARTAFTPGKKTSGNLDQNWFIDYSIPVGIPAIDALINENRFVQTVQVDTSSLIVSDTNINSPIVTATNIVQSNIVSIVSDIDSTATITETTTQDNNGAQERVGGTNGFVTHTCYTPTFSPVAGSYTGSHNITIISNTFGATIRYTVDGTTPTQSHGTIYTVPVVVASSLTVKAIAYKTNFNDSSVASAAYVIS